MAPWPGRPPTPGPPAREPADTRPRRASVPALSNASIAVATPVVLPAADALRLRVVPIAIYFCPFVAGGTLGRTADGPQVTSRSL